MNRSILARLLASLLSSFMIGGVAYPQVGAAPAFEIASVKPHNPGGSIFYPQCLNGRLRAGATMYLIIMWAYDLHFPQSAEVDGQLPEWAKRAEGVYDIDAKAESPVSDGQCRLMLRRLLAERFKLAAHQVMKEGDFYELVVLRGGHKMQADTDADNNLVEITINGNPLRTSPQNREKGMAMSTLASLLGTLSTDRRLIVDGTGLQGKFKFSLAYSTDPLRFSDPDMKTAVQKQLGLKLERHKGPVEHFVLDHIERPSLN